MNGLNIYLKEDKGSDKLPSLDGECWIISMFVHLKPMEKICLWDPLELLGVFSCEVLFIPPGRRDCLSDERCKKTHVTRMHVFLQANSTINPKQQSQKLVFCFWGTHSSSPDPDPPTFSFQGVHQNRVCSALDLLGSNEHHTLSWCWQQSLWLIPALWLCACTHVYGLRKCIYISLK